jgi:hypothetical protein
MRCRRRSACCTECQPLVVWLQDRGQVFAFHLRARFPELGRASEFGAFWRQVFATLGLPRAMAWLDQEISVP